MEPHLIHRPAPRVPLLFGMALLLTVVLPGVVVAPERFSSGGAVFGLALFVLFELGLVAILLRRVDVFVDDASIRLIDHRWPLPGRERSIARADVRAVELEPSRSRRTVRLVLVRHQGAPVLLTGGFFGRSSAMSRDKEALEALLRRGAP